jgi:hypothetical protein
MAEVVKVCVQTDTAKASAEIRLFNFNYLTPMIMQIIFKNSVCTSKKYNTCLVQK